MQHLFQVWESFAFDVGAASYLLLLSDYDGTLTPIVDRPDMAILSPESKEKLRALAKKPEFSVGIISGRALKQIKSMVGIEEIYYAGNHGLEIEGPALSLVNPVAEKARTELKELAAELANGLIDIKGIIVEDKEFSLSIHYRLVKEGENDAAEIFHKITSPWLNRGKIRITTGKKVWEVRPPIDWHKGKAVETIKKEIEAVHSEERGLTIYMGDDKTDEDAFMILHHPQEWGIIVGGKDTTSNANYFLNSTSEVMDFLSRLYELK